MCFIPKANSNQEVVHSTIEANIQMFKDTLNIVEAWCLKILNFDVCVV